MTEDKPPGTPPRISPLAVEGLRLRTGTDEAAIATMVLEAVVPSIADAAVVFAAEDLLRGGGGAVRPKGAGQVALRRIGNRVAAGGQPFAAGVFPPGEVIVFGAASPYAQCLRRGEPAYFTRHDTMTLDQVRPNARETLSRFVSFLAVPLSAGADPVGLLTLARGPGRGDFGRDEVAEAALLAAHAGAGIVNAVTLRRYQSIADALQRGLLAAEPSRPTDLEVAGRCLAATGNLVGGDWYDIIPLPGGRTGLIVGDVMGHGPEAAAVMAQLRAAAHALAQLDLPPAELLGQLDRTTTMLRGIPLTTCVYAVVDPAGESCTIAAAGHLPPVLRQPDARTRTLELPAGQSLGLGQAAYGQARIKLRPGAVIGLYTDGLVETRTRSFEEGILALRSELDTERATLDDTCDGIVRALARHPEDDVTLILARVPAPNST
ncbi:MAG TPA: PP2C family protein-serine/threonine phosphatase [Trebonia sp.]|nr:PP2C family protein-serine/threonine phosphatase [Trebonia sp.]